MNDKYRGYLKLTRFNEYVYFVLITTLLGVATAGGQAGWRMLLVLVANWLTVGFAFMINDVEDAPDDALNPEKVQRNPVSAGLLTPTQARVISFIVAFLALACFALLGWKVFVYGAISLFLGLVYSYHGIRLKKIAILDLASHCWLLAGLQFLTGYYAFARLGTPRMIFPLAFVLCVSLYGELFNELRDLEGDRKAGLRHTAIMLGEKWAHLLMLVILGIGVLCGVITFFFLELFPLWVIILMALLVFIQVLPILLKFRGGQTSMEIQTPMQKPLEKAAALALLVHFLMPVLLSLFQR